MAIGLARGSFTRPTQQTAQVVTVQAPTSGIDVRSPAGNMSEENCLYTYNFEPAEYGMLLRTGYREWAIDVESAPGAGDGIRSIITFEGVEDGPIDDRLFAVTREGIWNVTDYDTPPSQEIVFADQGANAGFGVYCHYIDQSGEDFLLYADSKNGLFEYTSSLNTWAQATNISGPTIENIAFVVVHKQRLWMIEENSTSAWYLPVASKNGQATQFFFGSKFAHGGELRGLYNWTIDGGDGIDDRLVALSSSGDVIPYTGDDPSSADSWQVVGSYYIGALPKGRNVAGAMAGDLYFLCSYGLIAMDDLIRGTTNLYDAESGLAFKISRPLRQQLATDKDKYGWEPKFLPSQGVLIITTPPFINRPAVQYTLNVATRSWGYWRDVPMTAMDEWDGKIFFGDSNNRILVMDVTRDNVLINQELPNGSGVPIQFSMLTSYQKYGTPGQFKTVQYIRPDFVGIQPPAYTIKARYDYDVTELQNITKPPLPEGTGWDVGIWDSDVWSGDTLVNYSQAQGSGGLGRSIAIALKGEASDVLRLLSFDVVFTSGGPM